MIEGEFEKGVETDERNAVTLRMDDPLDDSQLHPFIHR